MNTKLTLAVFAVTLLAFFSCQPHPDTEESRGFYFGVPTAEIEAELKNLMSIWYPRIVDTINGGYWTNFEYDWRRSEQQPKMLVTQARGLWTAARMAQFYPEDQGLRNAADHGYEFLTTSLWDETNGGFYLNWTPEQPKPSPPFHLTYANAFALYALAEYAKINKDPSVLEWVKKAFLWLEAHAHDAENAGYFNLVFLDSTLLENFNSGKRAPDVGWGGGVWKGQNTSIHVLEALTNTYQVFPDALVKERLEEMLTIVRDTIVGPEAYLRLYFTNKWQVVSYKDSSRQYILEHLHDDHVSFGHDIETAFLLVEAGEVLYGEHDEKTMRVAKKMLDHTLKVGFAPDYNGLFDKGYYFKGEDQIEILDKKKVWWAQAEAWHALGLFSNIYPEEKEYAKAFKQMWIYIKTNMIDPEHGGWYNSGLDEDPDNKLSRKAHQWKGAYHNGRALVQVLEYAYY